MKQLQGNQREWNNIELELRQMTINDWSEILNEASPNKFNLIMILLCRFATDLQIRRLYKQKFSSANIDSYTAWKEKFELHNPNFFEQSFSYKFTIHQGNFFEILHYSLHKYNRTLQNILLFPGNAYKFQMPTPCLLKALEPLNCNLSIIRRKVIPPYISSFYYFYSIYKDFKKITGESVINSTILSCSGGVMPALLMGSQFNSKKIICISPGKINFNQLNEHFTNKVISIDITRCQKQFLLIAAKANKDDSDRSAEISKIIQQNLGQSSLELIFVPNHKQHTLPAELATNGFDCNKFLKSILIENGQSLANEYSFPAKDH